jgi:hypothetical protein
MDFAGSGGMRHMRRMLAALLIALTITVGFGTVPGADAADPGAEAAFVNGINGVRAGAHIGPLSVHPVLTAKAQAWAQHMAATGCLCHSNLPDGVTVGWRKLGENIGRGPSVGSVHDALVHSAVHYANMVDGSFQWVGVGVAYGGGQLYVAEVFMNGDAPAAPVHVPAWSNWAALGGNIASAPSTASWGPNRLDVFATNSNGALIHKWWDGYRWNGWESLGGDLSGTPTVASWAPNRIDVLATNSNGALVHKWWDGYRWNGFESLGGSLSSAPAAVSWAPGRLDVFGRGSGGSLAHKWYDGRAWSGWENLGGGVVGDPAAVSWAPGRVDVFVRGTNNALYHRFYGGGWAPWESLGGTLTDGPTAASWGPGRIDVFVRGTNATLYHQWYGGQWVGWESLGGSLTAAPGATAPAPQRIDVFVRGSDKQLWQRAWR